MRIVIDGVIVQTDVIGKWPGYSARAIAKNGRFVNVDFYENVPRYQAEIDAARKLVRQLQAEEEKNP